MLGSRLVFTNAIASPGFRLAPSCSPIASVSSSRAVASSSGWCMIKELSFPYNRWREEVAATQLTCLNRTCSIITRRARMFHTSPKPTSGRNTLRLVLAAVLALAARV